MANAPSVQVTSNVNQAGLAKLEKQIRDRVAKVLQQREQEIERLAEEAAEQIVMMLARGGGSVSVAGSSFQVTPVQAIEHGPIAKLLRDTAYLGELGIPDPHEAVRHLKNTIHQATSYRGRVFRGSIRMSARFNPVRLLKLNPHPGRTMPNGEKIPVESWLQWTTGPNFDSRGTPGFGLARVGDILAGFDDLTVRKQNRAMRIADSSRTFRVAGADAGVMLRIETNNPRATGSQFEVFAGGPGQSWRPTAMSQNFWNDWWNRNRPALRKAFREAAGKIISKVASRAIGK